MVVCIWNASHLWVPWHLVMMEPWLAFHFCVIFNVSGWPSANQCNTNYLVCIGSTIECWKRQDAAQVVAQVQYWSMTYFFIISCILAFWHDHLASNMSCTYHIFPFMWYYHKKIVSLRYLNLTRRGKWYWYTQNY